MYGKRSKSSLRVPGPLFLAGSKCVTTARIFLALLSVISSFVLAWVVLVHARSIAHADPGLYEATVPAANPSFGADPWGLTLDNSGHIWVAVPQCDVNVSAVPICSHTIQGSIVEYNRQGFSNGSLPVQTFVEPANFSSPFFLAFDANWNLWFTEPVTSAIGELNPNTGQWSQWQVPTAGASPLDLTFDQYGHIWFTELSASQVGVFDPTTGTFIHEYPTPTSKSNPYGITGPDPASHSIWFAENNADVHRIGRITPNPDGSINGVIQEYLTNSSNSIGITPHLITFDNQGDIWWSEGYDGSIGRLVINQAANGTSQGVTEYVVPAPPCPIPPGACGTHISGIAVDSNGTVWFDDSLSSRYGSFVPGTATFNIYVIDECVTNNTHPHDGLVVDSSNNIWISEVFANKLAEALPGTVTNPQPCSTPTSQPTAGSSPTATPTVGPSPTTTTTSTLPPGPVNPTWYFAEGKVGQGFTEWLTIQNPDPVTVCNVSIQYLLASGSPVNRSVNVLPNTRSTESVNSDLQTPPNATTNRVVSTIVSVTNTPTCRGVVAERPMYFLNFKGVSSGTDSLGATHLGTDYYFADVSSLPGYNSYITILNPPGSSAATVTASYFLKGIVQGTDTLVVQPGTRGTIIPRNFGTRVATWVHSSTPVVVERPAYFDNYSYGNALHVTGSASVVGAPAPSNDWRFAEGYTGAGFQENLVLANFGTSPASATVVLEYDNGSTLTNLYTIPAQDQFIVDVNAATANHVGNCAPSCALSTAVSAEITTPAGTPIVAERELFFHYTHTANGRQVLAMGGTDITGQAGTAVPTSYSFAEGYTNSGYDEWLTLQNPGTTPETIWVTLINGKGTVYAFPVKVGPHTRSTTDIVAVVSQHVYHNGDGYLGYEVSMTVQTTDGSGFVAERPMYWNGAGSQGGDVILGYVGN